MIVIDSKMVLAVTLVLLGILPLVYVLIWRKKSGAHFKALFLGALGFVVSARVLEVLVHFVFLVADTPISRAINGSTILYVLYGTTMAGVFEEVGRWVMFTIFRKHLNNREDALMYGIGHGGIEVWTVTLPVVLVYFIVAVTGGAGVPAETAAALMPSIEAFGFGMAFGNIIERIFCMGIHISLTLMVYHGVCSRKKKYLFLAVLFHMLVDVLPALYQRGVVGLALTEVWLGIGCVALCFTAYRYYGNLIGTREKMVEFMKS